MDKVNKIFGKIESLEIKNTKITFKAGKKNSEFLIRDFPFYLNELINEVNKEKGIFLVIDDINGLSESKRFVDWYKNFSDTSIVDKNVNLKLYILLAGYPEKFDNIVSLEPSFGRIFHHAEIDTLNYSEVTEFFTDTFESVNIKCEKEVIKVFTEYSLGIPLIMQHFGDSSFYLSNNNKITKDLINKSITNAITEIGNKQIK